MKIREYVLLIFLGILVVILVGGVLSITTIQRHALEAGIDHELLTAATMAESVLPEGYHDRIMDKDSVSATEYQHIIDQFNNICTNAHLEQIWSVMVLDGKTVYTSSTPPHAEVNDLELPVFLQESPYTDEYTVVFTNMQPHFQNTNNQWGLARAVLVPYHDSSGRKYVIGVSRSLTEIDSQIQSTIDYSLLIVATILILGAAIGIFAANRLVWPIEKLTQTTHRITEGDLSQSVDIQGPKELQDLAQSINFLLESNKKRKSVEEALTYSENRYHQLFDEMAEGFALHEIITDENGKACDYRFLEINPAFERLTGLKRADLVGHTILEVIPQTEPYWIETYGEVALKGKSTQIENYASAFDKWYEVKAYCPKHGQFAVTFSDITRRKQAEKELQITAKFPSQNPNPVLRISPVGQVLFANTSSDLLLSYWNTRENEWLPDEWKTRIGKIFAGKAPQEMDIECGQIIYSCNFVPILDEDYVNVYGRDATQRRQAEQEIKNLNRVLEGRVLDRTMQLESSNRELEAFAYSVSHDLRAPLRGIDGWSQALEEDYDSVLDAKGRQYLNRVRSETRRMGQLIDDLLKLSRISRSELKYSQVALSDKVQKISERLKENEHYQRVEFLIQPDLNCTGDSQLLEIALTNLLENACKFSGTREHPKVKFGQTQMDGRKAYFIRDNGVGFDMAFTQKLFSAFQRLHAQTEFPGTGIGLATVQRIIHRHGGTIWADAQLDTGATFFFTLLEGSNE